MLSSIGRVETLIQGDKQHKRRDTVVEQDLPELIVRLIV